MSQVKYFEEKLSELLHKFGTTGREKIVLDYIEKEIKNFSIEGVTVHRDDCFGLYAIVPAQGSIGSSECLLFDVNVDTLHEDYEEVFVFTDDIFNNNRPRKMVTATGLDPRIGVMVMLSLIKSTRFKDLSYIVLFSTNGKCEYEGSRKFSTTVNIEKTHSGCKINRIVVLNVVEGIKKNEVEQHPYNKFLPIIGKGFIPIQQTRNFKNSEELQEEYSFFDEEGSYLKKIPRIVFSICCSDKDESESICSITDALDMLLFLSSPDFFLEYIKINNEDEKVKKLKERFLKKLDLKIFKERVQNEEVEGESDDDE